MENEESNGQIFMKAAKTTNAKSLGSAIAHELIKLAASKAESKTIKVRAIGVQAVNQAVKAIAIANGFVGQQGMRIKAYIGFINVDVQDRKIDKITGIIYTLVLE